MITSVRFCLSYDLLNVILSPSKFVYFNENLNCCNGRRHDVTCSRGKCNVTCGHKIIYDMTLATENSNVIIIKKDKTLFVPLFFKLSSFCSWVIGHHLSTTINISS